MTLCRIITHNASNILTRSSTSVFGHHIKDICIPSCAITVQKCLYASPIHCGTSSVFSSTFKTHESYEERKSGKWKLYFATAAGLCGALGLMKSWTEEAYCAAALKTETTELWRDYKVTLYQYQTCPFSTKARTFLTYYQVPFEIIEVHPIFKEEIKFSKKYKKVPIVTIEGKEETHELHDSSLIVSIVITYIANAGRRNIGVIMKDYPSTEIIDLDGEKQEVVLNKYWLLEEEEDKATQVSEDDPREIEAKWRQWTDDHLVHLISPNVYRTYIEAYQAFDHHVKLGRFNGTWEGVFAKVFGSLAMWMISMELKKKYCKEEDVRMDLYRACNEWCDVIGTKKFLGGDEPNLADLSVYSVLNVMEGLVSFEDMIKYTRIKPWYRRVKKAIEAKQSAIVA